jgi:hypothetical protein
MPAWRQSAAPSSTMNAPAGVPRQGFSHGKKPAGESSAPPPPASALLGKRGWVERGAS